MNSLDPRIRRADPEHAPASGGRAWNEKGKAIAMFHIISLLIFYAGSSVLAQTMNTDPGIDFDHPTPHTLEWIRLHHLRSVRITGTCGMLPRDSSDGYFFAYSGDTLVLTHRTNVFGSHRIEIDKYDGRDTLHSIEFSHQGISKLFTSKKIFNSCGRKTLEISDDLPKPERWTYKDDGNTIQIRNDRYLTIQYYGPNKRLDSVAEYTILSKGKDKKRTADTIADEVVHYVYGSDNLVHLKKFNIGHSIVIDSLFYYPNGILSRSEEYDISDSTPDSISFGGVTIYDTRGNPTWDIKWMGDRFGNGGEFDTTENKYTYDSRGRPTILTSKAQDNQPDETRYEWGEDDRIIGVKSFDEDGNLTCDFHYVYEF